MRLTRFGIIALTAVVLPISSQTLVVLNKDDATAQLFELASGKTLATLPTGNGPHEVAVSRDGALAVVADYGGSAGAGSTLTVIDLKVRQIVRTIKFGAFQRPHGIVFLKDNRTVVVTAERSGVIVTVDVVAGEVKGSKPTGQTLGHMVVMSPDERTAYVANITPGTLSIIDYAGTAEPVVVKVGTQTEAINITPNGKEVWLGSNNTGKVYVVDVVARKVVDSIQTKGTPYRIAFTPDGKTALVINPESDEVQQIDAVKRTIRQSFSVAIPGGSPARPFGVVITPNGKSAWITLSGAAKVLELDIESGKVLRSWEAGKVPDGIGLSGM